MVAGVEHHDVGELEPHDSLNGRYLEQGVVPQISIAVDRDAVSEHEGCFVVAGLHVKEPAGEISLAFRPAKRPAEQLAAVLSARFTAITEDQAEDFPDVLGIVRCILEFFWQAECHNDSSMG